MLNIYRGNEDGRKYNSAGNLTTVRRLSIIGKGTECPLAKYKIPYDNTPWIQRVNDSFLTPEEQFAVCANCRYSKIVEDNGDYIIIIPDDVAVDYCLDCPVHQYDEARAEIEAEAMFG